MDSGDAQVAALRRRLLQACDLVDDWMDRYGAVTQSEADALADLRNFALKSGDNVAIRLPIFMADSAWKDGRGVSVKVDSINFHDVLEIKTEGVVVLDRFAVTELVTELTDWLATNGTPDPLEAVQT